MNPENMRCSVCRSRLVHAGHERLETLEHHVSNPNQVPPAVDVYRCPQELCVTRDLGMRWTAIGETYYSVPFTERAKIRFIGGETAPLGSWERAYKRGVRWEKRTQFQFVLFDYMVEFQLYRPDLKLYRVTHEDDPSPEVRQRLRSLVLRLTGRTDSRGRALSFLWGWRGARAERHAKRRNAERVAAGLAPLW